MDRLSPGCRLQGQFCTWWLAMHEAGRGGWQLATGVNSSHKEPLVRHRHEEKQDWMLEKENQSIFLVFLGFTVNFAEGWGGVAASELEDTWGAASLRGAEAALGPPDNSTPKTHHHLTLTRFVIVNYSFILF